MLIADMARYVRIFSSVPFDSGIKGCRSMVPFIRLHANCREESLPLVSSYSLNNQQIILVFD